MALTREQFDKLRASGLSTEQIINFERGYVPGKKETFLQGLGRDIASPFIRGAELVGSAASLTGSSVKALYQTKTGQQEKAKQTMADALKKAQDRTTAKVNVFGREEAPITTNRQAVGAGLEVGSNIIGGGAAKNVFQTGLKTGLKTLAKQGAKEGLAAGLTYGLGTGLQSEGGFGQVAKETALGGVTGLVGGAVLAPVIGAGEKGLFKITNYGIKAVKDVAGAVNKKIKGVVTADDIERELLNIQNSYQKTRKMMDFSKDAGSETRKRLISADVLSDVTDDAGIMRTKTPGGAKDQYKLKTIDGIEGLVKETLVKEGKSVSPDALKGKMINDIMNSGLEGKALKTALNNVDGEIEGLMLRATPDGQIPLDVIHDAKISTAELAFKNLDPGIKKEGKSFAGSYKRIIEETSDEPIEAINKELQKDYKVLELLDVLDGKKVKGGKLGKYFAQIGGNIVGGAAGSVGGPVGSAAGTIIGGEIAGKIKGQMLKNTFGQSIGSTIEKSRILVEASNKVKAPRLLLPAPKPGSPLKSYGSGPTINLPSKTQSTLDNAYSYNLGKRNTMYNTPNTTIKKPIKLKSNNKTSSITPVNKKVKPIPKSKGETLKSSVSNFTTKAYKEAPLAKTEIDTIASTLAKKYKGKVALAPLKKEEKVIFNIKNKYNGDYSRVSDIARNTIIVSPEDAPKVFKELQKNPNYFSGKFVDPKTDLLGYSGYNTKYRASNGHIAEIQINTPEMIYAKEPAESAIKQLGNKLYNQLNKQYNGTGGKGHLYYDKWAKALSDGDFKLAQNIQKNSTNYYRPFISRPKIDFTKPGSFAIFRKKDSNFMIASAENPMGTVISNKENIARTKAFRKFLDDNYISYHEQLGKYGGNAEASNLIEITNPKQRILVDKWLAKNSPQAENIIIKDGKAVRYDPRTNEAYQVDLTKYKGQLRRDDLADDFYSEIAGKKYALPLYDDTIEKTLDKNNFIKYYNN